MAPYMQHLCHRVQEIRSKLVKLTEGTPEHSAVWNEWVKAQTDHDLGRDDCNG